MVKKIIIVNWKRKLGSNEKSMKKKHVYIFWLQIGVENKQNVVVAR